MEPLATRIENAAEQTAAAAQETASTTAESVFSERVWASGGSGGWAANSRRATQ